MKHYDPMLSSQPTSHQVIERPAPFTLIVQRGGTREILRYYGEAELKTVRLYYAAQGYTIICDEE